MLLNSFSDRSGFCFNTDTDSTDFARRLIVNSFPSCFALTGDDLNIINIPNDTRLNKLLNIALFQYAISLCARFAEDAKSIWVQYPVNIRFLKSDVDLLVEHARDYSPYLIHSDYWSGAPSNSFNIFSYLYCDQFSTRFRLGQPFSDRFIAYQGSYVDLQKELSDDELDDIPLHPGSSAFWPTRHLHRLALGSSSALSIDFRFCNTTPCNLKSSIESFEGSKPTRSALCYLPVHYVDSSGITIRDVSDEIGGLASSYYSALKRFSSVFKLDELFIPSLLG